jgi:hypothetical protein
MSQPRASCQFLLDTGFLQSQIWLVNANQIDSGASKKRIALSLLLLLLLACQSSFASLVIMLYHNETMYLASDSIATFYSNGQPVSSVRKIFKFSDNCCASITGFAAYEITNDSGNIIISMHLVKSLENACAEETTNSASLNQKMVSIATQLNDDFYSFSNRAAVLTGTAEHHEPTQLQFVGYDAEKNCFFVKSCLVGGARSAVVESLKEYRGSQWQFVYGDNLTPEIYKQFFPDFPKNIELPKLQRDYE